MWYLIIPISLKKLSFSFLIDQMTQKLAMISKSDKVKTFEDCYSKAGLNKQSLPMR